MAYSELITFYNRVGTVDEAGQKNLTWEIFVKTFAEVKFRTGTESNQNSEIVAMEISTFKVRYFEGITADMRINYDGNNYDIISINKERRTNTITITASKGDNQ